MLPTPPCPPQLGALSKAHEARTSHQAASHESHALTLGILGLTAALEEGRPLGPHLAALAKGGAGDPLVDAALQSVPATAAQRGVPTR